MKLKKFLLIVFFFASPVFLWGKTTPYWDIGSGGFVADFGRDEVSLQFHIGDIYFIDIDSHFVFDFQPVVFEIATELRSNRNYTIIESDLTNLYLVNAKLSWLPLMGNFIWFGPCVSTNCINPFNFADIRVFVGTEFALVLPIDLSGIFSESILAKIISVEAGVGFDYLHNLKPALYTKVNVHLGCLAEMFLRWY